MRGIAICIYIKRIYVSSLHEWTFNSSNLNACFKISKTRTVSYIDTHIKMGMPRQVNMLQIVMIVANK